MTYIRQSINILTWTDASPPDLCKIGVFELPNIACDLRFKVGVADHPWRDRNVTSSGTVGVAIRLLIIPGGIATPARQEPALRTVRVADHPWRDRN
ncbi:conserved hypothetical protein [Frankia canadensis]|uniref:Uncharacterized protein n=1 Tax=Frankia canadensis TaxID=1836972 RepID=A0A2I2KWC1_9ACTN|nr:conserved hypothetical protein [Frankia canadensis]SOU57245.1 conserved hypothetical protein [Frankia canadensis]